jgi:hypothetical protein
MVLLLGYTRKQGNLPVCRSFGSSSEVTGRGACCRDPSGPSRNDDVRAPGVPHVGQHQRGLPVRCTEPFRALLLDTQVQGCSVICPFLPVEAGCLARRGTAVTWPRGPSGLSTLIGRTGTGPGAMYGGSPSRIPVGMRRPSPTCLPSGGTSQSTPS